MSSWSDSTLYCASCVQTDIAAIFFSDTIGKQSFIEHKWLYFTLPSGEPWKVTMCTPAWLKNWEFFWKSSKIFRFNIYWILLAHIKYCHYFDAHQFCFLPPPTQYQLQKRSPWRVLCLQWEPWMVLIIVVLLMGLVSYVVHWLMVLVDNPPPPRAFKLASVSFGLLAEILLLKWVFQVWLCTFRVRFGIMYSVDYSKVSVIWLNDFKINWNGFTLQIIHWKGT